MSETRNVVKNLRLTGAGSYNLIIPEMRLSDEAFAKLIDALKYN